MYETNTNNLGTRHFGGATSAPSDKRVGGFNAAGFTTEPTTRTDVNDAVADDTQSFLAVPAAAGVIGQVQHEPSQSGNIYTWSLAGTGSGDFSISNQGVLSSIVTLTGSPYAITARHTEGSPLFRYRDISLTITVAA